MAVEGKLPAVPETILKRRKRQAENRALGAKDGVKSKVCYEEKDYCMPNESKLFAPLFIFTRLLLIRPSLFYQPYMVT